MYNWGYEQWKWKSVCMSLSYKVMFGF